MNLIGDGGPDANDNCDTDAGGNNLQNYPVLTNVITSNSVTTVTGFLPSAASTTYRVEFFANNNCDPSGFGEGQFYLGYTNLTTAAVPAFLSPRSKNCRKHRTTLRMRNTGSTEQARWR